MKKVMALALIVSASAFASVRIINSSNVDLGAQNKLKCGSGLTCSVSSGLVQMSVPALDGVEGGDASLTLSADESDDNGDDWKISSVASGNALTVANDASGSLVTKLSIAASTGNVSLVGALAGDGGDALSGFLSKQVTATATTITAAQCGSTFINAGAIEMELPEASTVLGCELTFIVGNASAFTVDPDAGDQVVLSTNAAGDSLIADAIGEVLKIQAISASAWAPMIQTGTWTDSN